MTALRPRSRSQLALAGVTKRYGEHIVLDRADLTVAPGERVGVIGDNGSGKSTLLRLLANEEAPDNGELTITAPGGVGYLPQTADEVDGGLSEGTVADIVDAALLELRVLERHIRATEARLGSADEEELSAYGDLLTEFEVRDGYEADARVEAGLYGLGLPGLDRQRPLHTLSGGERSRLALAAMLAASPELLLLDEPTNDLDDRAIDWLEERLRRHRGTVIAVTHDRTFLAEVTNTVVEVDHDKRTLRRYGNGYNGFLAAKSAERARWIREYEDWKLDLARQQRLVENNAQRLDKIPRKMAKAAFGHGAFKLRGRDHGARSRIRIAKERVERLTENPVASPPVPLRMTAEFVANTREEQASTHLVTLEDVRIGERLDVSALSITPGERVLVTGPNGAGKTTLMRVLAGELRPETGTVSTTERVGVLHQEEPISWLERTVLQAYAVGLPGFPEDHREELTSLGLFHPADIDRPLAELSVGQRRRVDLARLTSGVYELLLLDEPTNHFSPALVEELEESLSRYPGALVIVTHDRRIRRDFTGRHLRMCSGAVVGDSLTT